MATPSSYSVDADGCPYERETVTSVPDKRALVVERCLHCGAAASEPCNAFCITQGATERTFWDG